MRYALSNLFDFDPAKDAVAQLLPLDAWAVARLNAVVTGARAAYDGYEFHTVYHSVVDFCATDLSAMYFDIQKDTLYTSKASGPKRRSAQTALYQIAQQLLIALAPIMSFTAEEAWGFLPGAKPSSVFLADFPAGAPAADAALMERYAKLFAVRGQLMGLLEAARRDKVIGKSLEAKLLLTATGDTSGFLKEHLKVLREMLIVSQVELSETPSEKAVAVSDTLKAEVLRATGNKCPRCWTYEPEVGAQELCNRCLEATT